MLTQNHSAADGGHTERLMMTLFRAHLMTNRLGIDNCTQCLGEKRHRRNL